MRIGEAILFAPNGVGVSTADADYVWPEPRISNGGQIVPLVSGYLVVKSRLRITRDGGHSILAVKDDEFDTRVVAEVKTLTFEPKEDAFGKELAGCSDRSECAPTFLALHASR